jgi:hypothetical protein
MDQACGKKKVSEWQRENRKRSVLGFYGFKRGFGLLLS